VCRRSEWNYTGFPSSQLVHMNIESIAYLKPKLYKVIWMTNGTRLVSEKFILWYIYIILMKNLSDSLQFISLHHLIFSVCSPLFQLCDVGIKEVYLTQNNVFQVEGFSFLHVEETRHLEDTLMHGVSFITTSFLFLWLYSNSENISWKYIIWYVIIKLIICFYFNFSGIPKYLVYDVIMYDVRCTMYDVNKLPFYPDHCDTLEQKIIGVKSKAGKQGMEQGRFRKQELFCI